MSRRPITKFIEDSEALLAKYKAVHEAFPNATSNYYMEFTDKSINQTYTHFAFQKESCGLYVLPYCEVIYNHNGKEETAKVHSSPKRNKLVHLTWWTDPVSKKKIMKFSRMAINMKNNNFKGDMLESCKSEIMLFVKDNPGYHIDTTHLEPRLKKLLTFI